MTAPVANQPVVDLDAFDDQSKRLWREALAVMAELNGPWTLVGGFKHTERRWLRRAEHPLALEDSELQNRTPADRLERARVAFRLLIAP